MTEETTIRLHKSENTAREFCNIPNTSRFVFENGIYTKVHDFPFSSCGTEFGPNAKSESGVQVYVSRSATVVPIIN